MLKGLLHCLGSSWLSSIRWVPWSNKAAKFPRLLSMRTVSVTTSSPSLCPENSTYSCSHLAHLPHPQVQPGVNLEQEGSFNIKSVLWRGYSQLVRKTGSTVSTCMERQFLSQRQLEGWPKLMRCQEKKMNLKIKVILWWLHWWDPPSSPLLTFSLSLSALISKKGTTMHTGWGCCEFTWDSFDLGLISSYIMIKHLVNIFQNLFLRGRFSQIDLSVVVTFLSLEIAKWIITAGQGSSVLWTLGAGAFHAMATPGTPEYSQHPFLGHWEAMGSSGSLCLPAVTTETSPDVAKSPLSRSIHLHVGTTIILIYKNPGL